MDQHPTPQASRKLLRIALITAGLAMIASALVLAGAVVWSARHFEAIDSVWITAIWAVPIAVFYCCRLGYSLFRAGLSQQ